jgi:hypothetical protein
MIIDALAVLSEQIYESHCLSVSDARHAQLLPRLIATRDAVDGAIKALDSLLSHRIDVVLNTGDCCFSNIDNDPLVIAARKAFTEIRGEQ